MFLGLILIHLQTSIVVDLSMQPIASHISTFSNPMLIGLGESGLKYMIWGRVISVL